MKSLKRLLIERGLTQAQVADFLGVTQQAVQKWCANDTLPRRKDTIEKLANFLGVSPSVLAFSESVGVLDEEGYVLIPAVNISASCGGGSDVSQNRPLYKLIKVSTEWLRLNAPYSNPENLNILAAEGNSMYPTIKDGDLVFIDITQKEIKSDALFVFVFGDDLFLKRIQRIGKGIRVISDNPSYPPFEILNQELSSLNVIGKVCAIANINQI